MQVKMVKNVKKAEVKKPVADKTPEESKQTKAKTVEPALKAVKEMKLTTVKEPVADKMYISEEMTGSTKFKFKSKLLDKAERG